MYIKVDLKLVQIGIILSVILAVLRWFGIINISLPVVLAPIFIEVAITIFILLVMVIFNMTHKK